MVMLEPAPAVVGPISLTALVGIILLVHFLICLSVLASVSSDKIVQVSGVELSTTLQCACGAFCLIGIPVTIHAGVGAVYRVPTHLSAYIMYLFASLAVVGLFFVNLARFQESCVTRAASDPTEMATMFCGLPSVGTFFSMCLVLLSISVAIYLVWSLNENIKRRLETDLFRYQEPLQLQAQLAEEATAEAARQAKAAAAKAHRMAVPGAMWTPMPMQAY
eukprot:TRINITY_DN8126_c0_g1_i2.p1 TRINITY_DN8126_c0_g1~~TRINITY_DN8126_c0_g1_i2.p1  ORF type:complete len:220 (+),score=41.53 TRINITY_DN8126_c0_g1_i2:106-765(+)